MCGIAGWFNLGPGAPAPDRDILAAMGGALAHRGPDDEGIECRSSWGLVSRRLAIIGVEAGHQPLSNEDGTVWVAFNGEIYNHHDLRRELEERGHSFSGTADTEVLVHLYEEYADALVDHLQGMFAFALIDTRRERLLLARDRLGQKPLYYTEVGQGSYLFASELQALLCHPGVSRSLDMRALGDYLSLGYVPAPGSIFRGVRKLPPASILVFEQGGAPQLPQCYWHPLFEPKLRLRFADAAQAVRELLEQAVAQRLESEVPLGAFLSGGVDSTLIVGIMQQLAAEPVHTFTVGFADPRYDERRHAQVAADRLGTRHHTLLVEARDTDLLRQLIRHHGEPFADSSMLPTALLSRFTAQHVTVALSGDGGDELFGGYRRYRVMLLHRRLAAVPAGLRRPFLGAVLRLLPPARSSKGGLCDLRRLFTALQEDALPAYSSFQGIFSADTQAALLTGSQDSVGSHLDTWESLLAQGTARDAAECFLQLDLHTYLPHDLLCKVDIASMMHSLEVRSPFLDHRLVEYVARLPRRFKLGFGRGKRLLLAAGRDVLPPEIARRRKQGFGVPIGSWLRTELAEQVRELVFWQRDWDPDGIFSAPALRRLAEEHVGGTQDHSAQLWALLCFKIWTEEILRSR